MMLRCDHGGHRNVNNTEGLKNASKAKKMKKEEQTLARKEMLSQLSSWWRMMVDAEGAKQGVHSSGE
jgi:hypothetical protein